MDYGVNVVTQAHLPGEWTLRGNAGGILVGNEQTGALGIRVQGPVLTAGTSVVRAVGHAQVGGEFFLAWSPNATLGGSNAGGRSAAMSHSASVPRWTLALASAGSRRVHGGGFRPVCQWTSSEGESLPSGSEWQSSATAGEASRAIVPERSHSRPGAG